MKLSTLTIKNRLIIVDTNIFVYIAQAAFTERSGDLLSTLITQGNQLAISEITILELLWEINHDVRKKYIELIDNILIGKIPISQFILNNAAILKREYYRYGVKRTDGNSVKSNDLIIGATVSLIPTSEKPLLLTCDRDDFCEPLWTPEAYIGVSNSTGDGIKENVYLLKINHALISKKYKKKINHAKKKNVSKK